MKPRFLLPLGLACACFAPMSRAHADTAAQARKIIQAAYDKENGAVAKKDINGAFSTVAPDFMAGDTQGHQASLRDLKPQMQTVFQSSSTIKATTVITKFNFKGNQATVTVKNRTLMNLKAPKGGKPAKATVDSEEEDLWVKNGTRWERRIATVLSQTMTKNGKPFRAGG